MGWRWGQEWDGNETAKGMGWVGIGCRIPVESRDDGDGDGDEYADVDGDGVNVGWGWHIVY